MAVYKYAPVAQVKLACFSSPRSVRSVFGFLPNHVILQAGFVWRKSYVPSKLLSPALQR